MSNDQLLKTEMSLGSQEENKQEENGIWSLLPKPWALIAPSYFLTKPLRCWRASILAEVLRFPPGICCSGRGTNDERRVQQITQGGELRDPIPKFPTHPMKAEMCPVQPVPAIWDRQDLE